jgi:hypothetical protein
MASAISGHKTLAMVERVSHQNGTHTQTAMDKLQARFKLALNLARPRHTFAEASPNRFA